MRSILVCLAALFILALNASPANAGESPAGWADRFETTFTASCQVGGISLSYPKEFELSNTTMGVFLETDAISGQISEGSNARKTRESASDLLVDKQEGKDFREFATDGGNAFTARSVQGEQICQTYILVFQKADQTPLYAQFRWKASDPVDYTEMLDKIIASAR